MKKKVYLIDWEIDRIHFIEESCKRINRLYLSKLKDIKFDMQLHSDLKDEQYEFIADQLKSLKEKYISIVKGLKTFKDATDEEIKKSIRYLIIKNDVLYHDDGLNLENITESTIKTFFYQKDRGIYLDIFELRNHNNTNSVTIEKWEYKSFTLPGEEYETAEQILDERDIDFDYIVIALVYNKLLKEYNHKFSFETQFELDTGEKYDINITRRIIILNEMGILDNLKKNFECYDNLSVSKFVKKLLGTEKDTQTVVNGILSNIKDRNPYEKDRNKEFIEKVQELLKKY